MLQTVAYHLPFLMIVLSCFSLVSTIRANSIFVKTIDIKMNGKLNWLICESVEVVG